MYKSQHYQKCEKANRPGADFPDLSRDRIFQQPAPSGFKGTIRGELAVREGRNEDKWSKVQPRNCREKSLFLTSSRVGVMLLCSLFYAPEARKRSSTSHYFENSKIKPWQTVAPRGVSEVGY